MRHRKKTRRLGRKNSHREATLRGLATALITRESIKTTKVKAKEAQSYIDRLITTAKENTPESKRRVFALVRDRSVIKALFDELVPRLKPRSSGYTRVIPLYPRRGDGAPMAILELVDKKPKVEPKKQKKAEAKEAKKEAKPKAAATEARPKKEEPKPEPKKEHPAPEPKADIKEEVRKEKARDEDKKRKGAGFLKNLKRYFRGKST